MENILNWIIWFPIIGMVAIAFIPRDKEDVIKITAAVATGLQLLLTLVLWQNYDAGDGGMQFMVRAEWIPSFNITYILGVDGLSLPMAILTALLCFIGVFVSWNINKAVKGYFALFLLLDTGIMGVFLSMDFFLFYIFWEVMLLPMYFLIGIWGGPQREYAAIKFFLYTLFGSVLMLIGILGLYFTCGKTFDILELMRVAPDALQGVTWWGMSAIKVIWILLFIGFAIKVPVFPFHTWLPLAHVEAPTAISVLLAGILLKLGVYGILRINYGLMPDGVYWFSGALAVLGRTLCPGPNRLKKTGGLFQCESYGLFTDRNGGNCSSGRSQWYEFKSCPSRTRWRCIPNVQSRNDFSHALYFSRGHL